jgi:hypothetical protein
MANQLRVTLEIGPKGKKVAAVAPDWPGLERGAKTEEAAIERVQSYLARYGQVAKLAGMEAAFAALSTVEIVERYAGTGSTDFWGISFAFSRLDRQDLSREEVERELTLMQACWAFFDDVRVRVSAQMQKGPRGGGRDRDQIVSHTLRGLQAHRDAYCKAMRVLHVQGKLARTWPLRYLIRHTAYHTLDHAWEMEDKDLTVGVREGVKPRMLREKAVQVGEGQHMV